MPGKIRESAGGHLSGPQRIQGLMGGFYQTPPACSPVLLSGPYQAGLEPAAKQTLYRGDWKSGRVGGRNLGSATKVWLRKWRFHSPVLPRTLGKCI